MPYKYGRGCHSERSEESLGLITIKNHSTMQRKITLGLIQMSCGENPQKNLAKAIKKIEKAAKKGADIIALPELFMSKYFCQGKDDKNFDLAEQIPDDTSDQLSEVAKKTGTTIVASIFEKTTEGKYYNSTAVIGPDGNIIGKYRKKHIPSLPPGLYDEDYYFETGDLGFPVFQTPKAKISAPICYDQWFPEVARISAANGAEIIFYPTAIGWPTSDRGDLNRAEHEAWQVIQRSHSIANNVFVAAINRVGLEGNLKFWGTSFVSDPYGRVLARASSRWEDILIVECDLSVIESMRKEWAFLDERKVRCEKI